MICAIYFIDAQFSVGENPFIWMRPIERMNNNTSYPLIPIRLNYSFKTEILHACWNRPDKVALVVNNPVDIDIAREYGKLSWEHIYGYDWRKKKFISFKDVDASMRLTPNTKIWDRFDKFGDYNCFLQ